MRKRPLGNTGIAISPLGLGTVQFGRNPGTADERPSDARIAALLAEAQRQGVNLLDTAPAYGASEARIGEAIEGHRDEWVLCTKAGEEYDGTASHYDFSADHILRSVDRSLSRLRTDRLDILLLHSDGRDVADIESTGAFQALGKLKREGVVRAAGFSGKSPVDARTAMAQSDVLMCTINPGYRDEVGTAREAAHRGVGVLVKKPLARGREGNAQTIAETSNLVGVTSVLVGTLSPEHLAANATAIRFCTADAAKAPNARRRR